MEPIILVHGGAGDIPDSRDQGKHDGVRQAARIGYSVLRETNSALDAVEAAVKSMEVDENFNAGYGSVLTLNETVEMEASIMRGADLATGCVTLLRDIKHPISLARMTMEPIILVHGGAGDIPDSRDQGKHDGVRQAARIGYSVLRETNSALDAVEAAVKSMEVDENFNAGYGSVLTLNETVEMEASIMRGADLATGCVTLLRDIKHPISLARMVMEKTPHNFLGGEGAMDFAREQGVEILSPPGQLVTEHAKRALESFKKQQNLGNSQPGKTEIGHEAPVPGEVGTVGAVAIDTAGRIAVATSTGGITGKYVGRIGDTPLLGCGTFADDRFGGVSTTGHGESIMKFVLAKDIINRIAFQGVTAQQATEEAVKEMTKVTGGTAGAITIDKDGNIGIYFSSKKMSWAYQKGHEITYGIRH
uniref:Isoaspartyl peptidase/l-asparaginase n=1 Tax=Lutzomyia longipalpis TaxID=7200 RepID=A0A1B0CWE4_LUTLO